MSARVDDFLSAGVAGECLTLLVIANNNRSVGVYSVAPPDRRINDIASQVLVKNRCRGVHLVSRLNVMRAKKGRKHLDYRRK